MRYLIDQVGFWNNHVYWLTNQIVLADFFDHLFKYYVVLNSFYWCNYKH